MCGDQKISRQCYIGLAIPKKPTTSKTSINQVVDVDPRDITELPKPPNYEPVEPVKEIQLNTSEPHKTVKSEPRYPKSFEGRTYYFSKSLKIFLLRFQKTCSTYQLRQSYTA